MPPLQTQRRRNASQRRRNADATPGVMYSTNHPAAQRRRVAAPPAALREPFDADATQTQRRGWAVQQPPLRTQSRGGMLNKLPRNSTKLNESQSHRTPPKADEPIATSLGGRRGGLGKEGEVMKKIQNLGNLKADREEVEVPAGGRCTFR